MRFELKALSILVLFCAGCTSNPSNVPERHFAGYSWKVTGSPDTLAVLYTGWDGAQMLDTRDTGSAKFDIPGTVRTYSLTLFARKNGGPLTCDVKVYVDGFLKGQNSASGDSINITTQASF